MLQVVSLYEAGLFRGSRPPAGTAATRRSTPVGTSSEDSRPAHASASRQHTRRHVLFQTAGVVHTGGHRVSKRVSITSAYQPEHLQKAVVVITLSANGPAHGSAHVQQADILHTSLTYCINQIALQSQLPHKIVDVLFTITNRNKKLKDSKGS